MWRLGLIVNPIAGIGGRVGLKGSDGVDVQRRARALGAEPLAGERAAAALEPLRALEGEIDLLAPPGEMGEHVARRCGFAPRLVPIRGSGEATTAADTRRAAEAMREEAVALILFAGGDGTARDVYEAVGGTVPVLGIPAGVKIHSAVFGVTPRRAGELAIAHLQSRRPRVRECEVLDLDEEQYRQGHIVTRLHGCLTVPFRRGHVQNQKVPSPASDAAQAAAIAEEVADRMAPGRAYLLGPGTTTRAVAQRLGLPNTLVGVDILTRDTVLALDVGERRILDVMAERPIGLIVTPIGGQGFLFGRGNQPLSPDVIRRVGRQNILIVSPADKLAGLRGRPLLVDTGAADVDALLEGYVEVITGHRETAVYRVARG